MKTSLIDYSLEDDIFKRNFLGKFFSTLECFESTSEYLIHDG